MKIHPSRLDLALSTVFVMSIALMFLANESNFVREPLCRATRLLCFYAGASAAWNTIIYDLAVGSVVSLLFYVLIVRVPEAERKHRLIKSFRLQYRNFKLDCITNFLVLANNGDVAPRDSLLDQKAFREFFKVYTGDGQDRWHRVANALDQHHLDGMTARLETFRQEIVFLLNNMDVPDENAFEFLKRLSQVIYSHRNPTPDYDDVKNFCGFMWELLAGWDFVTGYRERDIVEEMIEAM